MRIVIQRVKEASVFIANKKTAHINNGLLILLGIEKEDTQEDIKWITTKICNLRIFNDANGLLNKSILDTNGDILLVSQFTLYASTKKGNRPSFIKAAPPEIAKPIYLKVITHLETSLGKKIQTGEFGAMMDVALINDGPITILIDSKNKE
jgi:D-tyrosyl-tRNA(Tyr) deacylase